MKNTTWLKLGVRKRSTLSIEVPKFNASLSAPSEYFKENASIPQEFCSRLWLDFGRAWKIWKHVLGPYPIPWTRQTLFRCLHLWHTETELCLLSLTAVHLYLWSPSSFTTPLLQIFVSLDAFVTAVKSRNAGNHGMLPGHHVFKRRLSLAMNTVKRSQK